MEVGPLNFQIVLKVQSELQPNPSEAELKVADVIGRLMHFWGFKRPMGRIWAVLYLSSEPVSAATLGDLLQMSSGAVSMALGELEKWGAVSRIWVPGERRDYFVAESSVWKMVQRVVRERELGLVRDFRATLGAAADALNAAAKRDGADSRALLFKLERVQKLEALAHTGERLLQALVAGGVVDPSALTDSPKPSSRAVS